MTVAVWVLLAFAGWTLLLLVASVGAHRWRRILTGRAQIKDFRADRVEGPDFYKRAMRAHANCVENLPVYAAVVVAGLATEADHPLLGRLALVLIAARVVHSIVHVAFEQTNVVTSLRFAFFFVQVVCMVWMGVLVALPAAS